MKIKYLLSTISFKIIVPITILFIIVMSIAFARMTLMNNEFANHKSIVLADNIIMQVDNKIEAAQNAALYSSSIYSDLPFVKLAYRIYQKTQNIDSANTIIKTHVKSNIINIKKQLGLEPMIQFYLPPAISLYKSWIGNYGEDLSPTRNSIIDISKNHKAKTLINLGHKTLMIRGISPVFNKNEYCGSVETSFPFNIVINRIIKDDITDYALYVKSNKKGNSEFNLANCSETYLPNNISKEDLESVDHNIKYKTINNNTYAIKALLNNSGEKIGFMVIQVDISENMALAKEQLIKNIIFAFIVIVLVIIVIRWGIYKFVVRPIDTLSKDLDSISKGQIIDNITNNETGIIKKIYDAFNVMLNRLRITSELANQIGEGNLDVKIDNIEEEDVIGQSLIRMRNNLSKANEIERINKIEEEKRNWATKGVAEFAEILRHNNNDIVAFSNDIIINLVKYTNSNQGGLFIVNDNDKDNTTLELTAAYAYDRKKYVDKTIKIGEGLVGTCAIEKETIFLTDVPDDYVKITSGLGKANPRCILIIPLKLENKIFGVIELASFKVFEQYQIDFIEKLGESIASTLNMAKTNILTQELLEQSQQQQEEMAAQEEEMRQNLEEMQATQEALEESQRQPNNQSLESSEKDQS